MSSLQIYLAGIRGTVPVHPPAFARFGGATSCVLVKTKDHGFILDAGTGLRGDLFDRFSPTRDFTMLISHAHVDHLMGFPIFSPLFDPARQGHVYLKTRDHLEAAAQIEALMAPPLWPIRTNGIRAQVAFHDVPSAFAVGDVHIETMDVPHPGGCTAYKLTAFGKSLVYATDFEPAESEPAFAAFAKNCDLLLLDAQYTTEEYARTKGFGHSTVPRSIALAQECGAQETIFIHHDPSRTDELLSAWNDELQKNNPRMRFGREGEEVSL